MGGFPWIKAELFSFTKNEIHFTNGFKIAEVDSHSALLWTRLCGQEKPNPIRHTRKETVFRHPLNFDENTPVQELDGGVSGTSGLVRAVLTAQNESYESEWHSAKAEHDFTVKIPFEKLRPNTSYALRWEAKTHENGPVSTFSGRFKTAPDEHISKPIRLVTSTCQYFWSFDHASRGFRTYDSMRALSPDFFIHTGDYVYYDKPGPLAKDRDKARHKWHAMNAWPALIDLFKSTPIYMAKDDHDLLRDDAYPNSPIYGELTFNDGLNIWHENAPIHNKPYRTFRWGKDLQFWLVEGREFRTPNPEPDGPDKSIWGNAQKEWLDKTLKASDATFKILFSPTPIIGPDREKKSDNHANKTFYTEGEWLRKYLSEFPNLFVVNGDRHWQYVSVDPETGLTEFSSGPVSDAHAQGWDPQDYRPEHRFLRVKGGFLEIEVSNQQIVFTHHDVNGHIVHQEKRTAV